jgi:hypothetical protein
VRYGLQSVHGDACFVDEPAALRTLADVRPEGGHAKAHLVIEEEVDLVRKKVPVVHGVSGASVRRVESVGFTGLTVSAFPGGRAR